MGFAAHIGLRFSRISLSSLILLSMALGLLVGLFFGEEVAFLHLVGKVWIKLLQMTVLPYVMLSLILGLGRLDYRNALLLAKKGGIALLLLWAVTLLVVFLFPHAFPDWKASSVISSLNEPEHQSIDFINLYIPSNPFHALANNLVPAVVLFSIALGVALIGVQDKQRILDGLDLLIDTLTRIANFVVKLTPIGVFAIMASAAGTMSFAEFQRLEVYLYSYIAVSLVMSLWILPGLVTVLTPLSYREVVAENRDALITAFATTSLFVVLPILMEKAKELIARHTSEREQADSAVEVIVPASFNFPHAGKLFTLTFILFAGWYSGYPVDPEEYPQLVGAGIASLFANVNLAIPFMLDAVRLPTDLYQLFVTTGVINARFATLLAAMFTISLTLIGAFSMSGLLQVRWHALLRYLAVSAALLWLSIPGLRLLMQSTMENSYHQDQVVAARSFLDVSEERIRQARVHRERPSAPARISVGNRLDDIEQRGLLRICYESHDAPFSYFNSRGELVGLDVELFHYLAEDLGVRLEFIPSSRDDLVDLLNRGHCDLGTGRAMTPRNARAGAFTIPIMERTLAILVVDRLRSHFLTWERARQIPELRLSLAKDTHVLQLVRKLLPGAQLDVVPSLEAEVQRLLEPGGDEGVVRGVVTSGERAAAWSLLHPILSPAIPEPAVHLPAAFPLPHAEEDLEDYMEVWLTIRQKDGTVQRLYDYWVLGRSDRPDEPRWSVIRDVLHWVD